jgi:hypothetical protein
MESMSQPLTPAQRQRLRTPANLWRALVPLLVLVGLLVLFTWPRAPRSDGIHVIDTGPPIAAARAQLGFPLVVPVGLSNRWRPTSTHFEPAGPASGASFRIGYVTPAGRYAELLEGGDAPDAVAAQYGPLDADGTVAIAGASWARYRTGDGHPLLRLTTGKRTTIVSGTAPQDELVQLAGSLG